MAAQETGAQKVRYGFLGLHSYDPSKERLVEAVRCSVELPWGSDHNQALELLEQQALAEHGDGCWVKGPEARDWECGCVGDALEGLSPCDLHMDERDAPHELVIANGVYFAGPLSALPGYARAGGRYRVPLTAVEKPLAADRPRARPSGLAG